MDDCSEPAVETRIWVDAAGCSGTVSSQESPEGGGEVKQGAVLYGEDESGPRAGDGHSGRGAKSCSSGQWGQQQRIMGRERV